MILNTIGFIIFIALGLALRNKSVSRTWTELPPSWHLRACKQMYSGPCLTRS
jgi:hypothetical protein